MMCARIDSDEAIEEAIKQKRIDEDLRRIMLFVFGIIGDEEE